MAHQRFRSTQRGGRISAIAVHENERDRAFREKPYLAREHLRLGDACAPK